MSMTRRNALKLLGAGASVGLAAAPRWPAYAASDRALGGHILGFTLAIHIPAIVALNEELPKLGYGKPELKRIESMQVVTQSVVAASTEIGEADIVSAMRASDAGGKVKLIGLVYNSTSQVLVVDTGKIRDFKDFEKPENVIALNSKGDFIYAMLAGVFQKHGVDLDKLTVVDVGGSGSRVKALQSGRVAAIPAHFDQAEAVMKQGPQFAVMIEPWKIYNPWLSEAWLVNSDWLEKPENQRLSVDMLKAVLTAFRAANADFYYFAGGYRKFATIDGAAKATDEQLRPLWEHLTKNIKAWPNDGGFRRDYFKELAPFYQAAGVLRAGAKVDELVEPRYLEQALKELGA
jgi:NitT/TauT family transport system substrate-binding protein